MDTDIIVVRHLGSLKNTVGYEDIQESLINNAVLIFEPNQKFIEACLPEIFTTYNADEWSANGPGKSNIYTVEGNFEYSATVITSRALLYDNQLIKSAMI